MPDTGKPGPVSDDDDAADDTPRFVLQAGRIRADPTLSVPGPCMIQTKLVDTESELDAILALQRRNLRKHLTDAEAEDQGFLIAEYTPECLRRMNATAPSVIAVDRDRVVGYALAATREARHGHPLLDDLFGQIDRLTFAGQRLADVPYVVVGQLCVDRNHRGQGLVPRLYARFRESLQGRYQFGVTDIARANRRSLQAHRKVGFQVIGSLGYDGLEWDVVLWDWTPPPLT